MIEIVGWSGGRVVWGSRSLVVAWSGLPDHLTSRLDEIPLGEAVQRRLVEFAVDFLVAGRGGIAWAFWLAGKLSAMLANVLVEQSWWNAARDALLAALQEISQPMLRDMLAGGLLYVVLMLAGIVMLMPVMTAARFLKVDRIILWTTLLVALFVSSTLGFDLIGQVEKLRVWLATAPLAGAEPGLGLGPIVALPMRATDAEMTGFNFNLPREFEDNYFQKVSYDPGSPDYGKPVKETETLTVTILGPFKEDWTFETQSSLARRNDLAWAGVMRALLMLPAAYVVLQFGIAFAVLSVAALLLIVFLVACLPIGFFEFGATLLGNIVKQYLYVVALTLLAGLLARIVSRYVTDQLATTGTGFDDAAFFIQFQVFIPLMILAGIAVTGLVKMSWGAMTGTLGLVGNIGSSVGAMAAQRGPEFDPLGATISTAGKVAAGASVIGVGGAAFLGLGGASLIGGLAGAPGAGGAAGAAGAAMTALRVRQVGTALTAAGNVGSLVTGGKGESVFRPMRRAGITMRSAGYAGSMMARGMRADAERSGAGDNGNGDDGREPGGRVTGDERRVVSGTTPVTRHPSPVTRPTPRDYPLPPRRRRRGRRAQQPTAPTGATGASPQAAPPGTGVMTTPQQAASASQQQAAPVSPAAAAMGPVDAQGLIVNNARAFGAATDAASWGGQGNPPRGMGVFAGPEVAPVPPAATPASAVAASPSARSLSPTAEAASDPPSPVTPPAAARDSSPVPPSPALSPAAEAARAPSRVFIAPTDAMDGPVTRTRPARGAGVAPPVKRGRGRPRKNAPPGIDVPSERPYAAPTQASASANVGLRQAADALDAASTNATADAVEMAGGAADAPPTFAIGEVSYQISRARYRELRAQGRTPEQIARQVRDDAALKQAARDIIAAHSAPPEDAPSPEEAADATG